MEAGIPIVLGEVPEYAPTVPIEPYDMLGRFEDHKAYDAACALLREAYLAGVEGALPAHLVGPGGPHLPARGALRTVGQSGWYMVTTLQDLAAWAIKHGHATRAARALSKLTEADVRGIQSTPFAVDDVAHSHDDVTHDGESVQLQSNDWAILLALLEADQPLTHGLEGQIEQRCSLEKSSVNRALKRLKGHRLVKKVEGGRGFSLTRKGDNWARERKSRQGRG